MIIYVAFIVLLLVAALVDMQTFRIPNGFIIALVALWVVWRVVLGVQTVFVGADFLTGFLAQAPFLEVSFADGVIGAIILGGGLLIAATIYELITKKSGMGGGDIKLFTVVGLFLGMWRGIICLLVACIAFLVLALLVSRARWGDKSIVTEEGANQPILKNLPFGPSILIGAMIALLIP